MRQYSTAWALALSFAVTWLQEGASSFGQALPAPPRYRITNLGNLGAGSAGAVGINDSGQIIGSSPIEGGGNGLRAFRTNGGPINRATDDLGLPAGVPAGGISMAVAINEKGQVVAEAISPGAGEPNPPYRSYLVAAGGKMDTAVDIGSLGGYDANSHGINDAGQVVGRSRLAGGSSWHAFLYTPGAGMRDLGSLGGPYSEAFDVNNAGHVVGSAEIHTRFPRAFRTAPNAAIQSGDDLGTLGGDYSHARAINERGQVAGMSSSPLGGTRVFRTAPNAAINPATDDLGALAGGFAEPFDMNEAGDIVGWSQVEDLSFHAFLVRGSTLYDLNDLVEKPPGLTLVTATGINNRGEIVASAAFGESFQALLLTPVPEPSAAAAVATAGAAACLLRRRRNVRGTADGIAPRD